MTRVFLITDVGPRPRREWRGVGRGLAGVVALVVSALDALVTSLVGLPPVAWCVRQVAAVVREAYQVGRWGPPSERTEVESMVFEGEIVDE